MSQLINNDRKKLKQVFYSSFDSSKWLCYFEKFLKNPSTSWYHDLGSGVHFQTIRPFGETLVLKIMIGDEEKQQELTSRLKKLQKALLSQKLDFSLMPYVEFFSINSQLAYVMLVGEKVEEEKLAHHWQPLSTTKQLFEEELAKNGFVINDDLQLKTFDGVPFLCDISDLNPERINSNRQFKNN